MVIKLLEFKIFKKTAKNTNKKQTDSTCINVYLKRNKLTEIWHTERQKHKLTRDKQSDRLKYNHKNIQHTDIQRD